MPHFQIRNAAPRKAEILLYDVIGEDFFGEGISAKRFAEELKALGELDEITLRINSPGGSVFDGQAIYNTLVQHPARVISQVDGVAASAASFIAMAGDEIRISEVAEMMIHDSSGITVGTADDHEQTMSILRKLDGVIAAVYAKRAGRDIATFRQLMHEETWFTAQEAVDAGLAEEIIEGKSAPENTFDFAKFGYRHVPQHLREGRLRPAARRSQTPGGKAAASSDDVAVRLRLLELDEDDATFSRERRIAARACALPVDQGDVQRRLEEIDRHARDDQRTHRMIERLDRLSGPMTRGARNQARAQMRAKRALVTSRIGDCAGGGRRPAA